MIFLNEKTPLKAIKLTSSKSRKIDIFPMGLVHGFRQKFVIFPAVFFRQYSPENCILWYFRMKKGISRLQKQEVQKVEKLTFFKGISARFWSKIGHFSSSFFSSNIHQENVFYDILKRKNAFLGYKNKKLK